MTGLYFDGGHAQRSRAVNTSREHMDSQVLETLLAREAPRLLSLVRSRLQLSPRADICAEDVLQEVWYSAFKNIESFEERHSGSLAAWLTMITENKLMDAIRRVQTAKRGGNNHTISAQQGEASSFIDLYDLIASPDRTPSRDLSVVEVSRAVDLALRQLPQSNRLAMWSYYIEGMSIAKLAEMMGKTKASIHALLHAGRKNLRDLLGNGEEFFSDVSREDEPTP